jgi:hypothetical protein
VGVQADDEGEMMTEKLNSGQTVSFEELLMSNTLTQEALINLLEKKGLLSKADLLEEIKRLKQSVSGNLTHEP